MPARADSVAGRARLVQNVVVRLQRSTESAQRQIGPALGASVLPFAVVLYLALRRGGYDVMVYGQVGVAASWILLLGALVGVLPVARIRPAGWLGVALLTAFGAWTALGIGWSESAERSVAELGRVAAYLGVFVLALATQGRDGLRRTVNAIAAAIALVGALALLSRLHPAWFPDDDAARVLSEARPRLNYPLNYWNGLAALMAMGIPLTLTVAVRGRTLVGQALAAAMVPALALAAFFTLSRGGVLEVAVGLAALLALHPRRLALLPTLALTGAGTAILIAGATQRDALEDGLQTAAARAQGDEMLAMTFVVCAVVGLLQVVLGLAARHGVVPRVTRSTAALAFGVTAVVAVALALASGLPGELSDRWDEFKRPGGPGVGVERLESAKGNGRYQVWDSAIDANATDPLIGIGPGTFEYWWAQKGTIGVFVRDAHSLYIETLGELGIVGFVLILALIGTVLVTGIRCSFRGGEEGRALLAGATAASITFAVAAIVDWVWELAVLPLAFLLLSAAILGPISPRDAPRLSVRGKSGAPSVTARAVLAALAVVALFATAIPLAATTLLRESQDHGRAGEFGAALDKAEDAESIEPFAASPRLQQALVLERTGDLDGAAARARTAARKEPTNWRTWLVLSRLEAERGRPAQAINAYREARSLNPRSELLGGDGGDGDQDRVAQEGAAPTEATELSSRNQFVVARAREAIGESAKTGDLSAETRRGVRDVIRLCHRSPSATYGGQTMLEVVSEASIDLSDTAPALAERLGKQSETHCRSR